MSNAFSDSFIGDRMSKVDSDVVSNLLREEKTLKVGFGHLFGLNLQSGYLLFNGPHVTICSTFILENIGIHCTVFSVKPSNLKRSKSL